VGATGNTGSATVHALFDKYKDKVHVRVAARDVTKADALKKLGAQVVPGDYNDEESLKKALAGVEAVWFTGPVDEHRAELAIKLVHAAKHVPAVKHLVLLSVQGAEYEAIAFGKQFRKIEKEIEASGKSWTFLRAAAFQENVFGSAGSIKTGVYPQPLGPDGSYAPVSVVDLGKAGAHVLVNHAAHHNKAYTLTGPEVLTGQHQAEIVGKAIGKEVKYVDPPSQDFGKSLAGFGVPQWQVSGYLELYDLFKKKQAAEVSPHLQILLGAEKPITYAQTVAKGAAAFK